MSSFRLGLIADIQCDRVVRFGVNLIATQLVTRQVCGLRRRHRLFGHGTAVFSQFLKHRASGGGLLERSGAQMTQMIRMDLEIRNFGVFRVSHVGQREAEGVDAVCSSERCPE